MRHDTFSLCVFLTFLAYYGEEIKCMYMHCTLEDFLSKSDANKVDTTHIYHHRRKTYGVLFCIKNVIK